MPPRRNKDINDVYDRIMARMEEQLDQFVDQFVDRMNDMMNPRRHGDRDGRRGEDDGMADDDYEEAPVFEDDQYDDVIEEEEGFVGNYPNFQENENNVSFSGVVLGVEVESMSVYDTDIKDVIEEEEGFVGKGRFNGEEDRIEDIVVVANDLYSGRLRLRKKRKADGEGMCDGIEDDMIFNQGKLTGEKVQGLGENKKGVSDAYKEYRDEVVREKDGIFHFRSGVEGGVDSVRCYVNMEQVKEIGEMIGVSWGAKEEDKMKESMRECGKKGWIRSIITEERPDVIRLQETKCGVVDNIWVEDIWHRQGYGYYQVLANGNSCGIFMIWDTRVFECKEVVGHERFVTVKEEWKGKSEEVLLVCIYGLHMNSQKSSLWDRICRLMNRWKGAWCIFRDLNVFMRNKDRLNSHVNIKEMTEFNEFINNMKLVEIPMGGRNLLGSWRECGGKRLGVREQIELEAEKRMLTDSERTSWMEARKQWEDTKREFGNMLRQKSRIRMWYEDPKIIKEEMARHNKNVFSKRGVIRPIFCSSKVEKISIKEARMLESVTPHKF
ncbi:RNA-directed DNA polymerase, eukaryota [Tanacetum coccineum]